MKQGILFWVWQEVNEIWDKNMIRISNGVKATVEQILASEEISPKEQECGVSQGSL